MRKFSVKINEDVDDVGINWVVTYLKNRAGEDYDLSISSDNLPELIEKLADSMSEEEFNSISSIKRDSTLLG